MIDVNCRASVSLTHVLLPAMVKKQKGAIVFLSSVAAYQPTPYFATYGATKAFNLFFAESLWAEYKTKGIDVLAVSPGYTRTEFHQNGNVTSKPITGWQTPEQVVDRCFKKLGKKPSTISGFMNYLLAFSIRFTPRRLAAFFSGRINRPSAH